MAIYTLQDGILTNPLIYGYSLTDSDITNGQTGVMLLSNINLYSANFKSEGDTLTSVAVNLSSISTNPVGTLGLTLQRLTSGGNLLSSVSQTYNISSFTSNINNPKIWENLRLSSPLSSNSSDIFNYTLSTSDANQLSLIGSRLTAINATGIDIISAFGTPLLTSFKPYSNFDDSWYLNGGGSSNFFDISANLFFNFSGDFTIECWVNTTNWQFDGTTHPRIISIGGEGSANTLNLMFYANAVASPIISVYTSSNILNGNISVATGTWKHVALTRSSNTMRLFVDGVQSGNSITNSTIFNAGVSNRTFISSVNYTVGKMTGYINQFRIVNGTALYTSPFTPPTTPLGLVPNTVFLLKNGSRFNQSLVAVNSPLSGQLVTFSGTRSVSAQSPSSFSNLENSLYLNGSTTVDFYTYIDNSNDFTVEFWMYKTGAGNSNIIRFNTSNSMDWASPIDLIQYQGNYSIRVGSYNFNTATPVINNAWTHVAIVQRNRIVSLYTDGVFKNGGVNTERTICSIGRLGGPGAFGNYTGYFSNVRVSRSAKYTSNFTPPRSFINDSPNKIDNIFLYTANNYLSSSHTYYKSYGDNIYLGSPINEPARNVIADSYNGNNLYINNRATLSFPLTTNVNLNIYGTTDGMFINSGGTLNIGTSSSPVLSSTNHIISSNIINLYNDGQINAYGAYKVPYSHLSIDSASSTARFIANQNLSSTWLSGDNIVLTPSNGSGPYDNLILSGFENDRIFRTTTNSLCVHTALSSNPYIPSIANITRNVAINSLIYAYGNPRININSTSFNNIQYPLAVTNNLSGYITINNSVYNNCNHNSFSTNWSGFFNGSSSYFNIVGSASNSLFGINFTIEAYVYITRRDSIAQSIIEFFTDNVNRYSFAIIDGYIAIYKGYLNTQNITTQNRLELNRWYHVALTFDGTTYRFYVNGISTGPSTNVDFVTNITNPAIRIGTRIIAAGSLEAQFNGYINNLRVTKNQVLYTGNFVPSKINLTTSTNGDATGNVVLPNPNNVYLLTLNNTFSDNSLTAKTLTNVGVLSSNNYTPLPIYINNLNISNNVLYRNNSYLNFNNLYGSNIRVNDNLFLTNSSSNVEGGLNFVNISANNISVSGNYITGLSTVGTFIQNCSGTGNVGGTINFNCNRGIYINNNSLNVSNIISVSGRDGVYIDGSSYNNQNTLFTNITSINNSNVGFKLSGNSLNYITPTCLNINGLITNDNLSIGIEAYNICGNLSNIKSNNNTTNNIKISIGNGPTIFNQLTGISNDYRTFTPAFIASNNVSILSGTSPFADSSDGSISINATSNYYYIPATPNCITIPAGTDFTVEFFMKMTGTVAQNFEIFKIVTNPTTDGWGSTNGLVLLNYKNPGDKFAIQMGGGSNNNSANSIYNRWIHLAFVRKSGNNTFFIDGVSACTFVDNTAISGVVAFALPSAGFPNGFFTGSFSNLIISNSALYTTNNFAVPSATKTTLNKNLNTYALQYPYTNLLVSNRFYTDLLIISAFNYNQTIIANSNINNMILSGVKLETLIVNNSNINILSALSSSNSMGGYFSFNNTKIGNGTQSLSSVSNNIAVMNGEQIANNHYKITPEGIISYDSVIFMDVNGVSEKLEPRSTIYKLRSSPKYIPVNIGSSTTVSVYVRKSAGYIGDAPRLMLKRNASLGYKNTVLATSVASNETWQLISGTVPAAKDNGIFEVYVDCSGNIGSGSINIDNWDFN